MRFFLAAFTVVFAALPAFAQIEVNVTYLKVVTPVPPTLSNLDPIPEDLGLAGAIIGLGDNATAGKFLGQGYGLETVVVPEGEDPLVAVRDALQARKLMILDAPAEAVVAIADLPEAADALIFSVAAEDGALRSADCRANVLHTGVSHAMRADGLMQFFVKKRWDDLVMIRGSREDDGAFADALLNSARKFGLEIRAEKTWAFDADMRRNAGQELPLFTQDFGDYDALLVADEADDFARYVPYNTWVARPVAGSEGLVPVGWSPVIEQWGAAQLQSRFEEAAGRQMRPRDYAAWAAMRTIGEAVTRTSVADVATLRSYILGPDFELAGFKGRPLTYRRWNGQLRQPIALVHPRALVAQPPLEGFLHRVNELDSLGLDEPESECTAFREN